MTTPTKESLLEFYNTMPGDIDEQAYNSDILVQRYFQRRKTDTIKETLQIGNADIVIDIGCGSGVQLKEVGEKGYSLAIGMDINQNVLKYARNRSLPNTEYIRADAQYLPIKTASVDKIICAEIIEHLISPQNLVNEIIRVLKKDGSVVITTPNRRSIWKIYEFFWDKFGKGRDYGTTHLYFYSESSLKSCFKDFSACVTRTIFFISPLFALSNNQKILDIGKRVDRIFERYGWGVSIVSYAKK